MVNYKRIYEREVGIGWDTDSFHVHHINMDRSDNRIQNLTLLPKKLHRKYHYYSKFFDMYKSFFDEKQLDFCSYINAENKIEKQFKKFLEIKKEVIMLDYLKEVYLNTKRFNKEHDIENTYKGYSHQIRMMKQSEVGALREYLNYLTELKEKYE